MTHRTPSSSPAVLLSARVLVLACAGIAPGCTASLPSDNDVVTVGFPGAHDIGERLVVPGTHLCPDQVSDRATSKTVTDCYAVSGDAPAWDAASACLVPPTVGPASLALVAVPCTVDGAAFTATDDTLTVEAVDPAGVSAGIQWLEEVAQDPGIELREAIPADIVPADGEALRVASGATLLLTPELRRVSDGVAVGWSEGELSAASASGAVEVSVPSDEDAAGGHVRVGVEAGADADVEVALAGAGTWPFTHVVADAGPYTLDAVHVAVLVGEDGTSQPFGARAVVRNAAGEIVFGAPITWASDLLSLTSGVADGLPSSDYAGLSDACRDPNTLSGEQSATVTASLDGRSVTADVVWTPAPGDGSEWTAPDACLAGDTGEGKEPGACGCQATSPGGAVGAAMGALLIALGIRRR